MGTPKVCEKWCRVCQFQAEKSGRVWPPGNRHYSKARTWKKIGELWGRAEGPHLEKIWAPVSVGQGRRPAPGKKLGACGAGPGARTWKIFGLLWGRAGGPHLARWPAWLHFLTQKAWQAFPAWPPTHSVGASPIKRPRKAKFNAKK